jgi:hypothetical protein
LARNPLAGKFSVPVSSSVALFLLLLIAPMPFGLRGAIAALLLFGWSYAGLVCLVDRYGRRALVAIIAILVLTGGAASYAYWEDTANRKAYSRIKGLRAYYVGTKGKILTGEVDYVYFDSNATDEDVRQFTELDGLQKLDRLVIKGTRISDATAKRFVRFKELTFLYLEGTQVTEETLEELDAAMPNCSIEAK